MSFDSIYVMSWRTVWRNSISIWWISSENSLRCFVLECSIDYFKGYVECAQKEFLTNSPSYIIATQKVTPESFSSIVFLSFVPSSINRIFFNHRANKRFLSNMVFQTIICIKKPFLSFLVNLLVILNL